MAWVSEIISYDFNFICDETLMKLRRFQVRQLSLSLAENLTSKLMIFKG